MLMQYYLPVKVKQNLKKIVILSSGSFYKFLLIKDLFLFIYLINI